MQAMRSFLMSSVSHLEPAAIPDDWAADRRYVARRVLGREPVMLRHPMPPHQVIWVESEPDDWRDFLIQARLNGGVDAVLRAAGRMH